MDLDSFWLVMGAALVLHGVKSETEDIDLGCTSEKFQTLLDAGYKVFSSKSGLRKIILDVNVSVYENFYTERVVHMDGIGVSDIMSIRKIKTEYNRTKDINDIELIDEFIARKECNDRVF